MIDIMAMRKRARGSKFMGMITLERDSATAARPELRSSRNTFDAHDRARYDVRKQHRR